MSVLHGGNVYEVAAALGCAPEAVLDFSASINPLGPAPGLLEEITRAFHLIVHYPDRNVSALSEALARHHGLPPENVVPANGSTELIYWLPAALRIKKTLFALPTFGEYRKAFGFHGTECRPLLSRAEDDLQPTVPALAAAVAECAPEAVCVTQPGSPSGVPLRRDVVSWLLSWAKESGGWLIVDEVFADFCEEISMKGELASTPNIVLIRSMTKFFGIPGIRLGYGLMGREAARRLREVLPPWSVSTLAQAAGVYSLKNPDYMRETLALTVREREAMRKRLARIPGVRVFPGRANYLLMELAPHLPPASALRDHLLRTERIMVRDCTSFEGCSPHHVRVAVRLPAENARLLSAIQAWAAGAGLTGGGA